MKSFLKFGWLFLIVISFNAKAQKNKDSVEKYITTRNFVFVPTEDIDIETGRANSLPPVLHLIVKPDSIFTLLYNFGTTGTEGIGVLTKNIGGEYVSTKFGYTSVKKKNFWDINIDFKDSAGTTSKVKMRMRVFDNGTGTLAISNSSKKNYSYNGLIYNTEEEY